MFVKFKNSSDEELFFALKDKVVSYDPKDGQATAITYDDERSADILMIRPRGGPSIGVGGDVSAIFKMDKAMIVKSIIRHPDWSFDITIE